MRKFEIELTYVTVETYELTVDVDKNASEDEIQKVANLQMINRGFKKPKMKHSTNTYDYEVNVVKELK